MDKIKAFGHLLTVKKIFDKLGVTFWLDGGTCLGAYKENDFLDTDFDVDVGMVSNPKIHEIIDELHNEGFRYFHLKEHPCGEGKQISCIRDNISLDIFIYYKRDDKYFRVMFDYHISGTVRFIPCVFPSRIFEKFDTIDFMDYGVNFNLPHPTEEYLTLQYGDWKTNKTKDEFHWQTDYKCMDMNFPIYKKPSGKRRWLMTHTLNGEEGEEKDINFFKDIAREGYKIYPIEVKNRVVIDGKKRLKAYKELGIPMVECYV